MVVTGQKGAWVSIMTSKTLRVVAASVGLLFVVALILMLARSVADDAYSVRGLTTSVVGAVVVIVLLGSLYEWIVHRYLYHGRSRISLFNDIYVVHSQGHHWHRFPPDRYVEEGPVERIPVFPAEPFEVCHTKPRRFLAWVGQFAIYLVVGILFAFLPAWLITGNVPFTVAAVATGLVEFYLFIRVHDVTHYPAGRRMERWAWFRFLDRHHYIHHIDNMANINFLLPLCDGLFGTLRLQLSEAEARRWPSFEEAKVLNPTSPEAVEATSLREPSLSA
jgi:hypothetical protein